MKKIVIIGANSFQNPLILKAKEMGYETHVFAWQDGSIGERTADYFYPISIIEKEEILEKCKEIEPEAVVTIASDLANITVRYLAEKLGMPCNSAESIYISTNKYAMREALKKHGIPTPGFVKVVEGDDYEKAISNLSFPLIVKPTDRSGSRGITKISSIDELRTAVRAAVKDSFEKSAIIEEYIDGEEYSCESISYEGIHHTLAVTRKYTTGAPHFIETGHAEPANINREVYNKIEKEIHRALDALKVRYGASHAEFKMDDKGNIRVIEIGSRMGGDCIGSHLVYLSTGYDFVKMVIDVAAGKSPKFEQERTPAYAAIRFVFSQKDLDVFEELKEKKPESIYYVSEIEDIGEHEVVDSSTRFGYYIFTAQTYNEVKEILER
ncbi:ATP-grasp domain-containing protein [Frisingicoccus sp.]|uniref:ATP-grasp domain-containing protein n=1 Tax=Frisingicoccus sp. TaxID=1918627 RepID=UPI003AB1D0CF